MLKWLKALSPPQNLALKLVLGFAALYRIVLLIGLQFVALPVAVDQDLYLALASGLGQGQFLDERLLFVSPLYPYLLALWPHPNFIIAIQLASGLVTTLLLIHLGGHYYQKPQIGLMAGALYTLCAPLLLYEIKLYPTSLTVASLISFVWLYEKALKSNQSNQAKNWLAAGVMLIVSLLLTPAMILLPPLLFLFKPLKFRQQLMPLLLPGLIAINLFAYRNYRIDQEWLPLGANLGITLAHGNLNASSGTYTIIDGSDSSKLRQHIAAKRLAEDDLQRPLSWKAIDRYWLHKSIASLSADLGASAQLFLNKLKLFFAEDFISGDSNIRFERRQLLPLSLLPVSFMLLMLLAVFSLPVNRWPKSVAAGFISVFLVNLVFYVSERYRAPALALLTLPAAAGLWRITKVRELWPRRLLFTVLWIIPTAYALSPPTIGESRVGRFNTATGLEAQGKLNAAYQLYATIYAENQSKLAAHSMVRVMLTKNQWSWAKTLTEEALAIHPDYPNLLNDMAVIWLHEKKPRRALGYLNRALLEKPLVPEAIYNMGVAYDQLNQPKQALPWYQRYLNIYPDSIKAQQKLADLTEKIGEGIDKPPDCSNRAGDPKDCR